MKMADQVEDVGTDSEQRLKLEAELKFLQKIIDQQNNIIMVSNGHELTMVNNQFLDFFAQPSLNAFKSEFGDISNTFVRHGRYFHLGKVEEGKNWIESLKAKKDVESIVSMVHLGEYEPKAFAAKVSELDDGERIYVLTFTDITSFAIQANQYFYQATHDKLTGIANLANFSETLDEIVEGSAQTPLAMIMFSLDDFKAFNATYGRQTGDSVIKDVVDMVSLHLREHDHFARLGGMDFALLLPKTDQGRALELAQKLNGAIAEMETYVETHVTASFAVAVHEPSMKAEEFMTHLQSLLSDAKKTGANQVLKG